MHDRVDAAQRVAKRPRVPEVAERDLDPDPLGAQAPRVSDQAPDRDARGHQTPQQRAADRSRRACQQQHRRSVAVG
jgi:hypothetical protein